MSAPNPFEILAAALRERLTVIADREHYARDPEGHLERLKAASDKIQAAQENLPASAEPELAHYLERRSYDKALASLEKR